MAPDVIVVTGASSAVGQLAAEALALAGHTVYASMRETAGRHRAQVETAAHFARDNGVELRTVEMDVQSQQSVDAAIERVVEANGRIDVLIHNACRMAFGPAEAFVPQQLADLYDVNVVSTQRINRAVLPHMRRQRRGLLIWVSSSSAAEVVPPYLAPYFAAKAAMDSLAVSYASELTRWGIETSIVVPGAFPGGTDHFANASSPGDRTVAAQYENGPCADIGARVRKAIDTIVPAGADVSAVADALVNVVQTPFGKRPFRFHIDPAQDGVGVGFAVLDRLRAEMLHRVGMHDLLKPVRSAV
ncbi:SDR family NAD(P)-dependent oxidoreductase [Mycobacterium sp. 1245852.3]|uniref:SDR family NAD(P)-dependent oxidoreductase n=1 Tax=Mycobacterium sp. 1245852.3 TaxID=1856860 RepID=UPI0008009224|nr:SDR family NAD(P)-dependent oxidoreductase [Mycobacterium sp. 1245852.3]OBJ85819.1 oxidoreductase [Mycobacterium sp. 1245852.3]